MSEPFRKESDRAAFLSRFALFVKDEKKGIYHNKGYETLEQNKGIYIRLETRTGLGFGRLSLSFSLHKFYNAMRYGTLFNYNGFSFAEANKAGRQLSGLLGFDLSEAVVKKYEVGINIPTEKVPEAYMKELDYIAIKGREYRIIEDRKHTEYKLFGTHSEKGKRIVYLFYDKTYEARSKLRNPARREEVPANILRIEMDVQRPSEKILFGRLFDSSYQGMLLREFRQRFLFDLHYKELPVRVSGLTSKEMEIYKVMREYGGPGAQEYYKSLYQRHFMSRDQYRYILSLLPSLEEKAKDLRVSISRDAAYLSERIKRVLG